MAQMRTVLVFSTAFVLAGAVSGCAQFPQLDARVSDTVRAQPFPDLVPLDGLHARLASGQITPDTGPAVEARVAHLKARAARLRGAVIDAPTRARIEAGVPE